MLVDGFGRPLLHLRISVTQKCNYRCIYCHLEGEDPRSLEGLSLDQLVAIGKAARSVGISKIKLTGGEPLVRRDILDVVTSLASLSFEEISMTTNGYYLEELAEDLSEAGLSRVNVNLPSLRRTVYREITGVDGLPRVLRGISKAIDEGMYPVKLNYVVLRGVNDSEFEDMIEFVRGREELILQVIELEPAGKGGEIFKKYYRSVGDFEDYVRRRADLVVRRRDMHNRPQYRVDGATVEFVRSYCNESFCMHCTRVRVTSDGKLKPCLLRSDGTVPLRFKGGVKSIIEDFVEVNRIRRPYYNRNL